MRDSVVAVPLQDVFERLSRARVLTKNVEKNLILFHFGVPPNHLTVKLSQASATVGCSPNFDSVSACALSLFSGVC